MIDRVLLCLATKKGLAVLQALIDSCMDVDLEVCTFEEPRVQLSYHEAITNLARSHSIPVHTWSEISQDGPAWVAEHCVDAIVCVGWRYLISGAIREAVDGRVLATHDSLLPKYRGYAPLVNALVNGETKTGVTVMLAAGEMDAGDIVYQESVEISNDDTIQDLIDRVIPLFQDGIVSSLDALRKNTIERVPQQHSMATYSLWRDDDDRWIDWSQSAQRIERTIRALGPPYLGARTLMGGKEVVVGKASVEADLRFELRQPGKVWKLNSRYQPVVVCGQGLLAIEEASSEGSSILPLSRLRTRFTKPA